MKPVRVPASDLAGASWPETVTLSTGELLADPARGVRAIAAADTRAQRPRLLGPIRLGADPGSDLAVLGLLTEATARLVPLEWELAGQPPWPLRTLVHLQPPSEGADPASRQFAATWRESFRFGLCSYRRGPGFAVIRDHRPAGQRLRIRVRDPWTDVFDRLVSDTTAPADEAGTQLLDELTETGLVLRLGPRHHMLPFRLRRWPVPYTTV